MGLCYVLGGMAGNAKAAKAVHAQRLRLFHASVCAIEQLHVPFIWTIVNAASFLSSHVFCGLELTWW